jgi:hypothetical protein
MMADKLTDEQKQSEADTKAYYERVAASQPTPTQSENDRAKLGFESLKDLDDKEADGSPVDKSAVAYTTRDAAPKK